MRVLAYVLLYAMVLHTYSEPNPEHYDLRQKEDFGVDKRLRLEIHVSSHNHVLPLYRDLISTFQTNNLSPKIALRKPKNPLSSCYFDVLFSYLS